MLSKIKNYIEENTGILIRLDDIAENMNWDLMEKSELLFEKYGVKPVLGVIPENKDNELFIQIINWAINNDIDLVWAINSNIQYENTFPKIFSKSINFASWSSDEKISEMLSKGLLDPQGIDSSLYVE